MKKLLEVNWEIDHRETEDWMKVLDETRGNNEICNSRTIAEHERIYKGESD